MITKTWRIDRYLHLLPDGKWFVGVREVKSLLGKSVVVYRVCRRRKRERELTLEGLQADPAVVKYQDKVSARAAARRLGVEQLEEARKKKQIAAEKKAGRAARAARRQHDQECQKAIKDVRDLLWPPGADAWSLDALASSSDAMRAIMDRLAFLKPGGGK